MTLKELEKICAQDMLVEIYEISDSSLIFEGLFSRAVLRIKDFAIEYFYPVDSSKLLIVIRQ